MPERVEVLITSNLLNKRLVGNEIIDINLLGGKFFRQSFGYFERVKKKSPIKVDDVFSKGKWTYVIFGRWVMTIHLGMSGYFTSKVGMKHNHVEIVYKVLGEERRVFYNDYRRYGKIEMIKKRNLQGELDKLGYDILHVGKKEFRSVFLKGGYKKVYVFLMDQSYLCGIGNYLVAEILYRSRISPHRRVNEISKKEIKKIYRKMKRVLDEVLKSEGCCVRDFKDINGEKQGSFQDCLRVYNQDFDSNGNRVKVERMTNGRRVHWVPKKQK